MKVFLIIVKEAPRVNQKVVFTLWRVSNVFYLLWDWYNTAFKPAVDQESESDCEESESDLSESESDDGVYLWSIRFTERGVEDFHEMDLRVAVRRRY